jgi:hypothetical protein
LQNLKPASAPTVWQFIESTRHYLCSSVLAETCQACLLRSK